MRRYLCTLLVLGGLAYAQAAPSPSFPAADAALKPTATTGATATSDMPPLPAGKATLVGGTISAVDHLRDRMVLQIFGGGRTVITFDERTRVSRDGNTAAPDDLKNGDRVYVDTVLDGTRIFARNIRIGGQGSTGQSNGQIVNFDPARGELTLRDQISPVPWTMRLAPDAVVLRDDRRAQATELRPGTLVTLSFLPAKDGQPVVRQISILASPGALFTFSGRVEHLDVHRGLLVLMNTRGTKTYELYVDPRLPALTRDVREGADVTVSAAFDGSRYNAQSITVKLPAKP